MTTKTETISNKEVPAAQSIQYICQRAKVAFQMLKELENEFQERKKSGKTRSELQTRKRILADIISVYVATLIDTRNSTNSLVTAYSKNQFVETFKALEIVKKCKMNRHNRSAHESKSYGHFVLSDELLSSDLEQWIDEVSCFVVFNRPNRT